MAILSRTGPPNTTASISTASTSEEGYYSGSWAQRALYRQIDGAHLGYGFPGSIFRWKRRPFSQRIHIVETDKVWIVSCHQFSSRRPPRVGAPASHFCQPVRGFY